MKPHGIKGQIKFKPYNRDSSILMKNMIVWLKKESDNSLDFKFFEISSISYNSLHPIIKLSKINSRNEAIELRDYILYISRSIFPEVSSDEIYIVDLIGCEIYNRNRKFVGIAKDIVHFSGKNDVVIVQYQSEEFMIPINNDLVKLFDVNEKYVIIDIADGLVDN